MKKEVCLSKNKIYKGKILDLYCDDVLVEFNNHKAKREYITPHDAVCILAKVDNKFIFVKQFRYAINSEILELPAGKIDENEKAIDAAIRELKEETGYISLDMKSIGYFYPSCGNTSEKIYMFYSENLKLDKQEFDENENIELVFLSLEEIKNYIKEGKINDSKAFACLAYYLNN